MFFKEGWILELYSEVVFDLVFRGFEAPQELGLSVGGA